MILLILFLLTINVLISADTKAFIENINSAKVKTDEILNSIFLKWQIKDYPNFLNSVGMTHTGWEVLKVRSI